MTSYPELERATILLVDDTPGNLAVLFEYLSASKARILLSQSGAKALEVAASERPDLILLDVMMPDMDGYETCRHLKSEPATREIPVLFMSALGETVDKLRGFEAGGVDYITKPAHQEEVLARVNAHVTIRNQRRRLMKFFSIVSHDLRAPFNSLISFTKMASENIDLWSRDELQDVLSKLYHSSLATYRFTENLLNWARLQQGEAKIAPSHHEVSVVVTEVYRLLEHAFRDKGVAFATDVQPGSAYVDRDMLHSVLRNLTTNAMKFTPPGGRVVIEGRLFEADYVVSVKDTGVGMEPEILDALFSLNQRVQRPGTNDETGTGIGLLICKEMVDRNGGSLTVASSPGKGSVFTVSFPRSPR